MELDDELDAGPIRVVLVDDQELVRAGFTMVLDAQPDIVVVGEAGDGQQALDLLRTTAADVVLMGGGLKKLPEAFLLGRHTYSTIRQNLFWAFFYNIIAIPVAAIGLLTPAIAALAMAFSDVVLLINSARLFVKKLR